ncbi:hypothetical protein [Archaeoglobus sulfaticallidus]|nr:hypothetical protein [Archaeoglobus sulfaticallidus]
MNELEEFISTWKGIIDEIKNSSVGIDGKEASVIWLHFRSNETFLKIRMNRIRYENSFLRIQLLESELAAALAVAVSKFKLHHRGILARIFGGILTSWRPDIKEQKL